MRKLIENPRRERAVLGDAYAFSMRTAAAAGGGAAPSAEDSGRARRAVAPSRVLLVEDEPGIVDFVTRGLEAEGFSVEAALDGAEGERLALRGSFDVVVLDLMLPGRSGLEILAGL